MFFIKIKFFIVFLILISGCGVSQIALNKPTIFKNINIETTNTKFDIILKKHLKRMFYNQPSNFEKFILKAKISFSSSDTLSVNGLNVLNSTKGTVKYSLIDLRADKIIKSGSIVSFPALSSSSSSLYSKDVSLEHIKERLCLISAQKLYMHVKLIVQKLN
jgi:hypothetical protein